MALPGILYPTSLPCWRLDSYNVAPGDVYAQVQWATGENRVRRVFTTQQRTDSVHLTLTAADMEVFHDWYENVLQAGLMPFSAEMANLGPGLLWFQAQFLGPYRAEPIGGEFWQVTFDLLITGDGDATPPDTSELGFAVAVPVVADAVLTVPTSFAFDVLVPVLARIGQVDFAFDVLAPVLASVENGTPAVEGEQRLWSGLALTPGASSYIDITDQEQLSRSWMEINPWH